MLKIITKILVIALGLGIVSYFFPGIRVDGIYTAIISALIIGLLNVTVKPILFVLTLPINILTLGLFTFVINASLFLFVASFIDGFDVDGFWYALLGSLAVTLVSTLGNRYIK